jgi:hypothetical protein
MKLRPLNIIILGLFVDVAAAVLWYYFVPIFVPEEGIEVGLSIFVLFPILFAVFAGTLVEF